MILLHSVDVYQQMHGLYIAQNLIAWPLYNVTTPFMLKLYGSVDYQEAS